MPIRLIFEPGKVVTWKEFKQYSPLSIAIDGYCKSGPRYSRSRRVLNINHHEGVERLAVRSSCDQALVLVKMGLYETFRDDQGRPSAMLYCNDCDQDVCFTTFVLQHPDWIDRPALKRLIRIEDLMDTSGGLFPVKKRWHNVRQLAWITAPYDEVRRSGELMKLDAVGMRRLVAQVHKRIAQTIFGRVKEITLDTRYEVMHQSTCWTMVRELGGQARIAMVEDGVRAFISFLGENEGRYRYVIGRLSHFVPFPIYDIFVALNEADGISAWDQDRWGGSDSIGGSPRERLSQLSPEEVVKVVEDVLRRKGDCLCPEHQPGYVSPEAPPNDEPPASEVASDPADPPGDPADPPGDPAAKP